MTIDFLAHVRSESARFADVLASTDPQARVPTCPDWTAADLLWHLGEVQSFWAAIVRERATAPDGLPEPQRPVGYDELLALFRDASAALVDALANATDDTAVWTWFPADQSVGFVRRRQAHEALIHRLDAELTAGTLSDVDPALATDGAAEVLEWMYSGVPAWAAHTVDGAVGRLSTTDTGASWLVQLGRWSGTSPNSGTTYSDKASITVVAGGEPTFGVSGTARDLDAWLWNRPTLTDLERSGDTAAFEAVIRSGVQ